MSTSVTFETNLGNFSFELYWDHAPKDALSKTCKNFSELAKRGYYNGVIFHRIIADFMAQSGDPTGTGRGGTSIYGQKFEDEITPELRFTGAGILAMANSGPNTNGSQFFITLAPVPYLDGKHTIFGRVSNGMRVVQRVGAVATDAQDSGLGPDSDSELSEAPPSPRTVPTSSLSPPPQQALSLPPPSPSPQKSHSSAPEPPWKARPRPKRQPSTTVPNPPSSPKRRKRVDKDTSGKGKDATGKGKQAAAGKGKDAAGTKVKSAKAVGKAKPQVQAKDPSPEPKDSTLTDQKASTSTGAKAVSSAPWKTAGKTKVSPPPAPEIKPAPFAKATPKPKPIPASTVTSKPPFNSSKSASSDLPRPAPLTKSTAKPVPSGNKPTRTTKRPTYNESTDSSDEEKEGEPKRHKRRKSHVEATPKSTRKPRPSMPAQPTPKAKARPELAPGALELRPASFLTKTASLSFMNKPPAPSTSLNLQPREDVWSYDDLTGLTWVKLDIHKCVIVPGNEQTVVLGEQWCWWPAEVKQNTNNGIKLALCGLEVERELGPCVAAETNILTFRKPNNSSVRFPTFKTAFSQPTLEVESPPEAGEAPSGEAPNPPAGESSQGEPSTLLPTSSPALEITWKQALARAFEIDTESNDGLVDIHLLFSQKSTTPREEDELTENTALGDQSDEEDEDVLENGTTVLCRYRTRYYPAKIISYHPREGKARRHGAKGKYKCVFADDSTKVAARPEIMTTLDDGFATCPLGTYQRYGSHAYQKPTGVREPSPAPRASSPAPESEGCTIDPEEYCSRERMRDQLKPVLPFLKGLIERRYIPGRGAVEKSGDEDGPLVKESGDSASNDLSAKDFNGQATGEESSDQTAKEPTSSSEPVLDRHAVFMQGGRARKNLAYSVFTGDLNEDDCEELMFEISRWALRGERWACEERASQEDEEAMNQEGRKAMNLESKEGEVGQVVQQCESTSQEPQKVAEPGVEDGTSPEQETVEAKAPDTDVDMQYASQETSAGQDSEAQTENKSGDATELEEEPLHVVKIGEKGPPAPADFRSLVKLQPPRPIGAPDYEGLTPEERMGYVSDVLYPEAAALILSYRRGIRTQPGPLADPTAEHALYAAGLQAAKYTCSTSDWVEQILAIRQLRQSNSKYQVEEQAQIVIAGGTKSRPKYITSGPK
ncbi:unnamed protein product [Rhizoctonia solani]|uniref:peptidylprolyl isomerase n=1 Tax=Rhizoctonia solani TaxID=456999 RepID=A0A8H2XB54_9AGAM|nr:unnamed protein product [Rhizoctonia solani]